MIQSIFIGIALIASLFGLARTPVSTLDYDWKNPPLFFGAVSYPASLDVFENPTAGQSVATVVTHSTQHSNANDALEALEAKIGINVSTPVTDSIFVGTSAGGSQWSTYATGTSAYFTNYLATGSTTLQNFTALQSTSTNATTTNFFSTTASSTNLFSTNFNLALGVFGRSTTSNATTTSLFSTIASSTNLFSADASFGRATTTDLDINTVSYRWPSGQGAANTVLTNNGSGLITWAVPASSRDLFADVTILTDTSGATTTQKTLKISAGNFGVTDGLKIETLFESNAAGSTKGADFDIQIGNGSASTTIANATIGNVSISVLGSLEVWVWNTNSASAQQIYSRASTDNASTNINASTTSAVNTASDFYISFRARASDSDASFKGISVKRLFEN